MPIKKILKHICFKSELLKYYKIVIFFKWCQHFASHNCTYKYIQTFHNFSIGINTVIHTYYIIIYYLLSLVEYSYKFMIVEKLNLTLNFIFVKYNQYLLDFEKKNKTDIILNVKPSTHSSVSTFRSESKITILLLNNIEKVICLDLY